MRIGLVSDTHGLPRTAALLSVRGRRPEVTFFELGGAAPRPFGRPVEVAL